MTSKQARRIETYAHNKNSPRHDVRPLFKIKYSIFSHWVEADVPAGAGSAGAVFVKSGSAAAVAGVGFSAGLVSSAGGAVVVEDCFSEDFLKAALSFALRLSKAWIAGVS